MLSILKINSSMFSERGVSSQLSSKLVAKLGGGTPKIEVLTRDLAMQPLPHFSAEYVAALAANEDDRSTRQRQLVAMGDQVIAQVKRADILIISAPMYNFNVPSTLKAWLDYLARAGSTFRYGANGPEGLLRNKKAYVITTRGGLHRGRASDTEVPFLLEYLNFVGIDAIEVIYAEGLNTDQREQGMLAAEQQLETVAMV